MISGMRCTCLRDGEKCIDKLGGDHLFVVRAREKLMQYESMNDQDAWLLHELRGGVDIGSPGTVCRCVPACALSYIRLQLDL